MTWGDLLAFIIQQNNRDGGNFVNETVTVYDQMEGEYFNCDLIEIEHDPDGVVSPGQIFLSLMR